MRLPNLTPNDVRRPALPNGVRPVFWERVDLWLKLVETPHDLTRLAEHLEIHRPTLALRRKQLKLPSLPRGRPLVRELTPNQLLVTKMKSEGKSNREIAETLGVGKTTVAKTLALAEKKAQLPRSCPRCDTKGVEGCNSCKGQGPHHHVCRLCAGSGYVRP